MFAPTHLYPAFIAARPPLPLRTDDAAHFRGESSGRVAILTTISSKNELARSNALHRHSGLVDISPASLRTALLPSQSRNFSLKVEPTRPAPRALASIEAAAADIQRLTAALRARREAAPDNMVELAALAVDLKRASVVWRQLVPTGVWA